MRHPLGPKSSLQGLERHPAVHVAYRDVEAYAKWAGKQLPTEAEWEFAARGGLDGADYAWGNELYRDGRHMANTWQGEFPWQNLSSDGYQRTSPVDAFPPNGYGLYDMIGNVWEWTTDWYHPRHPAEAQKACCIPNNPRGGPLEASYDPAPARDPDSPQSAQRRLPPLCAELLPPLPAGRPLRAPHRHLHLSHRLSLHRQAGALKREEPGKGPGTNLADAIDAKLNTS